MEKDIDNEKHYRIGKSIWKRIATFFVITNKIVLFYLLVVIIVNTRTSKCILFLIAQFRAFNENFRTLNSQI